MDDSDKGTDAVDCGIGSIVWVRRRNGSWWPGKILGPDELSASHLMSPRSGTPVKLLGREDASVDWYNLEKSKRVKPFRCGEFNDCIERVESSLGMPPKKREKYARREDAILHALELEKELLEKNHDSRDCSSNDKRSQISDTGKCDLTVPSESLGNGNGECLHNRSHSKKRDLPGEEKYMFHPLDVQKVKVGDQLGGKDDKSEVTPRMRNLQDFGLHTTLSKRKLSSSVALNGFQKPESDDGALDPGGGLGTAIAVAKSRSVDEEKSPIEALADESLGRRRDRCHPVVQVLQSTKCPVNHPLRSNDGNISKPISGEKQRAVKFHANRGRYVYLAGKSGDFSDDNHNCSKQTRSSPQVMEGDSGHATGFSGEDASGSTENTETDSLETDSLDSDTDMENAAPSDGVVTVLERKSPRSSEIQRQHGSMSNEEHDELARGGDTSLFCPLAPISAGMEVSKWQLKGKRNNRRSAKRSIHETDRRLSRSSICGTNLAERESIGSEELDLTEKSYRSQRVFNNRRHSVIAKSLLKDTDHGNHDIIDWEKLTWNEPPILGGYREDSSTYFEHIFVGHRSVGGRMDSRLLDVDLKVQSSYQRQHVPMISLMSKFNGHAIVGHPIPVESLENGSSEILLSAHEINNEKGTPPVWPTARRTANFRVPHSLPSVTLDGDESADFRYFNLDNRVVHKKPSVGGFGHKATIVRKSLSHYSSATVDRKFSRKAPKKMSLSSSQKIKTLSSISTEQKKINGEFRRGISSYQEDGLIKPETGLTAVAYIPIKLVFSRLHEELVSRHQ